MPLTASNTDAWTMAAMRLIGNELVPATRPALSIVSFQSVTSSALAGTASAAGANRTSARQTASFRVTDVVLPFGIVRRCILHLQIVNAFRHPISV
jgi:hypothetical protein